jgi:monothiol glutaredoxin
MKGTPKSPACGFSGKVSHLLISLKVDFKYVNILEHPDFRIELPRYAKWPTFPQLWVGGELVGGCDIVTELHENGELEDLLDSANVTYGSIIEECLVS